MIVVLADLTCPLQSRRIEILKDLPYKKILIHNATGKKLSQQTIDFYKDFIIFEQPKLKNNTLRYLASLFFTFSVLLKFKPKLVIVHWASRLYQTLALIPYLNKTITTIMGSEIMPNLESSIAKKKFFIKILIKNSKKLTVKSTYMKEILINNFKIDHKKIEIVTFGVKPEFFNLQYDKILATKYNLIGKKVFFSIRSMKRFYKIKEIVQAFIIFKEKTLSQSVLLVTKMFEEEDYFKEIKDIVNSSKYNKDIIFVEQIPYEKIPNFLSISNAVVSFVESDGLPHSMLEALAAKRFPIFRDLPQYNGFLEHLKNAYLVKDFNDLINAFTYVNNTKIDLSLSEDIKEFLSIEYQTSKYLKICNEILEK